MQNGLLHQIFVIFAGMTAAEVEAEAEKELTQTCPPNIAVVAAAAVLAAVADLAATV